MRAAYLFGTYLLMVAFPIWADSARLSGQLRLEEKKTFGVLSSDAIGFGLLLPMDDEQPAFPLELSYNLQNQFVELHSNSNWLLNEGLFSITAQLGAVGYGTVKGPLDLGLGLESGIFAGLAGRHGELRLGLQAGVESFVRDPGTRLPLRLVLGSTLSLHRLDIGLQVSLGADLEPALRPVFRPDLSLVLARK
jgi:hypothetical protein